jgi:hypothetical protein
MRRLLVIALLLLPVPALAWSPHGHRVVASLAYRKLAPATRIKIAALLKLNPYYARWIAGVSPRDRDEVAFLRASNWADDIREDPSIPEEQKHKDWHYVNRPYSIDGTPTRPPPVPNAEIQIGVLRRQLAGRAETPAEQSLALVWLIHLVADVHQPLHAIARFDRQLPTGDRGGTLILLPARPDGRLDNLHLFWDRGVGDSTDLGQARAFNLEIHDADLAVTDEHAWVDESFQAAKIHAYAPPITAGPGPFALTAAYEAVARGVCQGRVVRAGARLARLLDEALK